MSDFDPPVHEVPLGTVVDGRFELEDEVSRSTAAALYVAVDQRTDGQVMLRLFTPEATSSRGDEILEQAGQERNPSERKALYAKFQKIVAEELPVYWSYTLPYHTISSTSLGNQPRGIWATVSPLDRVYLK